MKILLARLASILAFSLLVASTKAQDQPSPANIALATELVSVMHLDQGMGAAMDRMKQMQSKIAASAMTTSSSDLKAVMQKSVDSSMDAASSVMTGEKMKQLYVAAYADTFTAEELQGAIDFYKSPIGQKWVEKQPQVSMAIMAKTTEMIMAAQPQMMDSIKKSMEALRKSTN